MIADMRMIGTVDNEDQAQRFSDYLLVVGVDAHIEESARGAWQVWVEHDDHQDRAKAELDLFKSDPTNPKYNSVKKSAAQIRKEEEMTAAKRRKNYVDYRTSSSWSGMGKYGTPVIAMMIAICFFVSLATQFGNDPFSKVYQTLLYQSYTPVSPGMQETADQIRQTQQNGMFADIRRGQVWRLITPIFIHYGPMHLIFNMLFFWRFGSIIESQKGSLKTTILVLCVALVSCLTQALWDQIFDPLHFSAFGGMSGVCGGLFGYAWMKHRYQPYEKIYVSEQEIWSTLAWFTVCSLGWIGPIANAAHWLGLLTGAIIGITPRLLKSLKR